MSSSKCSRKEGQLQGVLDELVREANESCRFSRRNRELNAPRFVQVLVLGWLQQADASLNELAQLAQGLGCSITGSAINERMGEAAIAMLGQVLVRALRHRDRQPQLPIEALKSFTAIHVTDSTQIGLPSALLAEFQGANHDAMVKLQVTLDYLTGEWVAFEMVDGKTPDSHSDLPRQQARAGSLNLFDLGYFKQERLQGIVAQDAYFVSRYQSQTALYEPESGERLHLADWLSTLAVNEAERLVELGSRVRIPVRLVVRRLPQKAAEARRRKAKKK